MLHRNRLAALVSFLMISLLPGHVLAANPQQLFDEGSRFAEKGNFEQARKAFDEAVKLDPKLAGMTHFSMGMAYAKHHKLHQAIEEYEKALKYKSNETVLYMNIANAHLALGQFPQATEAYRKLTELNPKQGWSHYNLGTIYLQQKLYTNAVDSFRKAIDLDASTFRHAYEQIGYAYQSILDFPNAISAYTKAVEANPRSFMAQYNLGLSYYNVQDADNAIKHYDKALELSPQSAETITNMGIAYYLKKDNGKAEELYTRALALKPELPQALFGMAQINRDRGDFVTAMDFTNKAMAAGLTVSEDFINQLKAKLDQPKGDAAPDKEKKAETDKKTNGKSDTGTAAKPQANTEKPGAAGKKPADN